MNNHYVRLDTKPELRHPGYPICGACDQETDHEDGQWLCPTCGTTWPGDDLEHPAENATLYADWAGEELTGPVCPVSLAWRWVHLPPDERDARIRAEVGA